jgi:hypothetical protein
MNVELPPASINSEHQTLTQSHRLKTTISGGLEPIH